jgi:hypothetical protein
VWSEAALLSAALMRASHNLLACSLAGVLLIDKLLARQRSSGC